MNSCYKCGATLKVDVTVSRSDVCAKCGSYVRCCMNCRFHDLGYHNECREPGSETISDREEANFCEWFKIADRKAAKKNGKSIEDARSEFDKLFKK